MRFTNGIALRQSRHAWRQRGVCISHESFSVWASGQTELKRRVSVTKHKYDTVWHRIPTLLITHIEHCSVLHPSFVSPAGLIQIFPAKRRQVILNPNEVSCRKIAWRRVHHNGVSPLELRRFLPLLAPFEQYGSNA